MIRTAVSSSTLISVGYDPSTLILELGITSGRIYQYFDVPQTHYDGLLIASSPGGYYNANIRDAFGYLQS